MTTKLFCVLVSFILAVGLFFTLHGNLPGQTNIKENQTHFSELRTYGTPEFPQSAIFLRKGPAPTSTTDKGEVFDAVVYLDLDNKIKALKADGTTVILEQPQ